MQKQPPHAVRVLLRLLALTSGDLVEAAGRGLEAADKIGDDLGGRATEGCAQSGIALAIEHAPPSLDPPASSAA
jgi:hypothetical protein